MVHAKSLDIKLFGISRIQKNLKKIKKIKINKKGMLAQKVLSHLEIKGLIRFIRIKERLAFQLIRCTLLLR